MLAGLAPARGRQGLAYARHGLSQAGGGGDVGGVVVQLGGNGHDAVVDLGPGGEALGGCEGQVRHPVRRLGAGGAAPTP